ncbi:tetratricopeptide repeat protein [Mesoaciditoga sp.]
MKLKDMFKNKILWWLLLILALFSVVALAGSNSNYYYTQGVLAFNAGDYAQAEKYLKTALMLNPALENNSDVKYMIGLSAWYAGDMVTARAYLPNEHFTAFSTSTKSRERNLVAEIARWESRSSEIINLENQSKKKKVSKGMEFLIFSSFLILTLGGFYGYKYLKHRKKKVKVSAPQQEEEMFDDLSFNVEEGTSQPSPPTEEKIEMPSDTPNEEDIKMKLQNLLKEDFTNKEEKIQLMEDPEEIINKVGKEATQEEILEVEEAVHELLSSKEEKSAT